MKNTFLIAGMMVVTVLVGILAWQAPSWRLYAVQTGSMGQAVPKGSLVLVRRSGNPLAPGTVASYRHPQNDKMVITHRVIGYDAKHGQYMFKGDSNQSADLPVPISRIIGTVDHRIRYLGYVCTFLKTPVGLLVGIYLPASLIIIYEISRLAYLKKSYRLNT